MKIWKWWLEENNCKIREDNIIANNIWIAIVQAINNAFYYDEIKQLEEPTYFIKSNTNSIIGWQNRYKLFINLDEK